VQTFSRIELRSDAPAALVAAAPRVTDRAVVAAAEMVTGIEPRPDAPPGLADAPARLRAVTTVGNVPVGTARAVEGECWIVTDPKRLNRHGYGFLKIRAFRPSNTLTHVIAHLVYNGPIADGEQVDHLCEVRACCRPSHLTAKTTGEHIAHHNRRRPTLRRMKVNEGRRAHDRTDALREARRVEHKGEPRHNTLGAGLMRRYGK
jgi:HNH endonuclease